MKNLSFNIAALSLFSVLLSCGSKDKTTKTEIPAVPVTVTHAEQGDATFYDEYPATTVPLQQLDLVAMANGYVTGIYFSDGQRVKKGQKLYQIDQDQYQAGIEVAEADLNTALANEKRAQKDADRYTELDKNDAIAKQVLDHSLATLEAAKTQTNGARAALQRTRVGLRYASITAPFTGTLGISQVRTGGLVSSGQTLLNTLSTDDPMAVDVAIDQKEIPRFSKLVTSKAAKKDSLFSLILPDGSIYEYQGKISLMDRAVNSVTGTIKTRLIFPNPNGMLKAGMTTNLRVKNESHGSALLIPHKSVVEQMGEYFVYLVQGDSVVQQNVQLGAKVGDKIAVKSGLNESSEIVTEGVQKLRNGSKINKGQ